MRIGKAVWRKVYLFGRLDNVYKTSTSRYTNYNFFFFISFVFLLLVVGSSPYQAD